MGGANDRRRGTGSPSRRATHVPIAHAIEAPCGVITRRPRAAPQRSPWRIPRADRPPRRGEPEADRKQDLERHDRVGHEIHEVLGAEIDAAKIDRPGSRGEPPGCRAVPPGVALELREEGCQRDHGGMHLQEAQRPPRPRRGGGWHAAAPGGKQTVERQIAAARARRQAPEQHAEAIVRRAREHRATVQQRCPEHRRGHRGES